jgi:hypothetical protein
MRMRSGCCVFTRFMCLCMGEAPKFKRPRNVTPDTRINGEERELKSLWSVRSKSCRGSCDDDDSLSNFTSELKMRQRCTLQDLNRARPASSSARPIRLASPLLSAVTAESTAKTAATKSDAVSDKLFFLFYPSGSFLSI